ncbi:MAG: discoidin domain-containing protein [Sulfuritalea sp.]|nr:discoidin domain-containing protein [Sulfuritalea sp.]
MSSTTTVSAVSLACALAASAALAAPINVAHLYGSATANQTYDTAYAANAIDNNNATRWVAPDHGTPWHPNWLVVDLGAPFPVEAIDLFWGQPGGYPGFTTVYSLFHGMDGANWSLIGSGTFVEGGDLNQISAQYPFSPDQSMRYVKYEVNGGSHWSSIAEIRVWSESQGTVPEPASLALLSAGLLGMVALRRRAVRF